MNFDEAAATFDVRATAKIAAAVAPILRKAHVLHVFQYGKTNQVSLTFYGGPYGEHTIHLDLNTTATEDGSIAAATKRAVAHAEGYVDTALKFLASKEADRIRVALAGVLS